MGLFKSIKKAFKKVGKAIKKVVKKGVKAVKKVAKKITSSKALRALVGAGMLFTGIGGLASRFVATGSKSFFANWANAARGFSGTKLGTIFRPAYNLGANVFSGKGPFGGQGMFSDPNVLPMKTSSGTTVAVKNPTNPILGRLSSSNVFQKSKSFLAGAASQTGKDLISAYAQTELFGDDPTGIAASGTREPETMLQPIEFAYQNLGIDTNDVYSNLTFGREDIGYVSSPLFTQETIQVG